MTDDALEILSIPQQKILEQSYICGFCDPASGKQEIKSTRARSAIVVIASYDIFVFVLYAWASRGPTGKLIEKIFDVCDQWKPRLFGIEANAMQEAFANSVIYQAKLRQKHYPIVPKYQPTKIDKRWRTRSSLQPRIGWRRIIFGPDQHELISEVTTHPMAPIVDLVDALASACAMLPGRHVQADVDNELNARLKYLRDTGADPDYIQQVAEGQA